MTGNAGRDAGAEVKSPSASFVILELFSTQKCGWTNPNGVQSGVW
jgi:hypothetical protein